MPHARFLTSSFADTIGATALAGLLVLGAGSLALGFVGGEDVPVPASTPAATAPATPVVDVVGVDVEEVPDATSVAPEPASDSGTPQDEPAPLAAEAVEPPTPAEVVLEVVGDALRTVVTLHNRGGLPSGPVTVSYAGLAGYDGTVHVLDTDGPVVSCERWTCTFDGVDPGEAAAGLVFTVDTPRCLDVLGIGRVTLEGDAAAQHVDVPWCVPTDLLDGTLDAPGATDEVVDATEDLLP